MHNIVIIDDNEYKMIDNIEVLSSIYEDATFYKFASRNKALLFLEKYNSIIDLLILDWNFPIFDGDMPEIGMGEDILREIERLNIKINTIICSSEEVSLDYDYSNVIGKILYSPRLSIASKYREILGIEECDDKKQSNYDESFYPIISRENEPITLKNFVDEEKLFRDNYLREKEQEKKRQKQLTKYKRKRSSDPWWKKN